MFTALFRFLVSVLSLSLVIAFAGSTKLQADFHCTLGCQDFCHDDELGDAMCASRCPIGFLDCQDPGECKEGWIDNVCGFPHPE